MFRWVGAVLAPSTARAEADGITDYVRKDIPRIG
jgi:hypothetical protein